MKIRFLRKIKKKIFLACLKKNYCYLVFLPFAISFDRSKGKLNSLTTRFFEKRTLWSWWPVRCSPPAAPVKHKCFFSKKCSTLHFQNSNLNWIPKFSRQFEKNICEIFTFFIFLKCQMMNSFIKFRVSTEKPALFKSTFWSQNRFDFGRKEPIFSQKNDKIGKKGELNPFC